MARPTRFARLIFIALLLGVAMPPDSVRAQDPEAREDTLLDLPEGAFAIASIPAVGKVLPHFEFGTLDGISVSSETVKGQTTVLLLWSTTCPGGAEVVAALDSLSKGLSIIGVDVVIMSLDKAPEEVRGALGNAAETVTVALAGNQGGVFADPAVHDRYKPTVPRALIVPAVVVLDADGVVRYSAPWHDLESTVSAARDVRESRVP